MIQPKISIVTPSFNQGEFIEDAILSVLNQDYPNFEHIIIDNCSMDGTLDILKKYPHLKWISEPDEGQSDALNKGFKMATGDIIGWLNADDYFLPEAFTTVANYVLRYPDYEVFYGSFYFVDKDGKYIKGMHSIPFSRLMAVYNFCYPSSGVFFRRSIFDRGLFLREDFHYIMDIEFYVRLHKTGVKFKNVPEFLSCFRWHEANKSKQYFRAFDRRERSIHEKRHEREIRLFIDIYGMKLGSNKKVKHFVCFFLNKILLCVRGMIRLLRGDYILRARERLNSQDLAWFKY